jgi:hypothetical protein
MRVTARASSSAAAAILGVAAAVVYAPILSHGFIVVPLALYFVWRERTGLRRRNGVPRSQVSCSPSPDCCC